MSWRSVQIKQKACSQDLIIFDLFKNKKVKYVGKDQEFASRLALDDNATNLILIVNSGYWISDLINTIELHLENKYESFYIGINRYTINGNDTNLVFDPAIDSGQLLINLVTKIAKKKNYQIIKSGYFDQDLGRYMNFVQPVTWVYGTPTNNI
jgi:hypothetical protein